MLRFFSRFQADFQLKSGWIEPLLVGGYAPFSPTGRRATALCLLGKENPRWAIGWPGPIGERASAPRPFD